jgi:hypothetical protein
MASVWPRGGCPAKNPAVSQNQKLLTAENAEELQSTRRSYRARELAEHHGWAVLTSRHIPRPAGESAGLRDDASLEELDDVVSPVPGAFPSMIFLV